MIEHELLGQEIELNQPLVTKYLPTKLLCESNTHYSKFGSDMKENTYFRILGVNNISFKAKKDCKSHRLNVFYFSETVEDIMKSYNILPPSDNNASIQELKDYHNQVMEIYNNQIKDYKLLNDLKYIKIGYF